MYRNDRIIAQKGIMKVASELDALSVSNRQKEKVFNAFDDKTSSQLEEALGKISSTIQVSDGLEKGASFSNGLEMFTGVRRMLSNKLGLTEDAAHDMTSNVITKSDLIAKEYGGDPVEIASNIINEMQGQVNATPGMFSGGAEMHPFSTNNGQLKEQIKQRLVSELRMSQSDAETYKDLVLKQSQDLATLLRPHKRHEIAMGMISVIAGSNDLTSIHGFKDSPVLVSALKMELGG